MNDINKTLTDLWKKGKLEKWCYYFATKDGLVVPAYPSELSKNDIKRIKGVVEKVPHYSEIFVLRKENELYKKRHDVFIKAYRSLKEGNDTAINYLKQVEEIVL